MTEMERMLLSALETLESDYSERERVLNQRLDNLMRELGGLRKTMQDLATDVARLDRRLTSR